jgi:2-polyprenyl-3-methyl-5-hydroxy-6-metoxy-1,4-benzoquinol methylase
MKKQLLYFDPRTLLGDRLGIALYVYCAHSILEGRSEQALYLYKKFISYFRGEVHEHTPENFITLIHSIKQKGFDPHYPVEANPKEQMLLNGSHRVAAAIALNITEIPYSLVFHDNRTDDALFSKIFTKDELTFLQDCQEKLINSLPEPLRLICKVRRFMRAHEQSFKAPFSSNNSVGALRLYQADDELGLSGKRNTRIRWSAYGLENLLTGSEEVLEIGCNVGLFSRKIAKHIKHLDAFDANDKYIDVARLVATHTGCNNIRFFKGRLPGVNLEKSYDFIISCAIHGWTGMNFLDYCRLLLAHVKPNGLILLESHEILCEKDWGQKRGLLAKYGKIVTKGLIDDVDHNIYQSEIREFIILRPNLEAEEIVNKDFFGSTSLSQNKSILSKIKWVVKNYFLEKLQCSLIRILYAEKKNY